jgi:poly-gamma-glutamate capsule biosynthesis protein CapA/YwtB (metallophosphatase superfamily)
MNSVFKSQFLFCYILSVNTLSGLCNICPELYTYVSNPIDSIIEDTTIAIDTNSRRVDEEILSHEIILDSLSFINADTLSERDTLISLSERKPDTFSIVMVGDVMLGTNYPSVEYLPPGSNCYPLLDPVKQFISEADISFCNLEGVFAGESGTPKSCKNPETCYIFRMPDEYVNCLVDAGFDLVSVANNHVNDFGYAGRMHAVKVLKQAGIHFAGFIDYPYSIFEQNGVKIGFCAFSTNVGVMDLRNIEQAKSIVYLLSDSCDIVIVSMHGGAEGNEHQHVTRETEEFLGADRGNVYNFSHQMIDAGADVIIGHGPHVTRAIEIYKGRFIAYSLGNFATYSRFNISGPNGIAPLINISVNPEGIFLKGKIFPIMQSGEGGAKPDPEKRVIYKLQDLTQTDFFDPMLSIDDEGNIQKEMSRE